MSVQNIVTGSLLSAFIFSVAGLAAARQPPALVRVQAATAYAVACQGAQPDGGSGYRDVAARTQSLAPSRAFAKAGTGYRDIQLRSPTANSPVSFACVSPPQLSASAERR
jgi:hypothetical protein